jgi:hypothetical protein
MCGLHYAELQSTRKNRQGSLSQEQQRELMESLETEGLDEIDAFLNLSAGYENFIKL